MGYINDLIINIDLATKPLAVQGFGKPLILGKRATGALIGKYGEYDSPSAMLVDGFVNTDPEYKMVAAMCSQSPAPAVVAVYIRDEDDSIPTTLDSIVAAHSDFYIFMITERDKVNMHVAGDWALSNEKIFIGCSSDLTSLDGRSNIREAYLIHDDAASFQEANWVGMCIPKDPGTITWNWKAPIGAKSCSYSLTQLNAIRNGHGQTICTRAGIIYVNEGITTGGEFIDVIQARDYVKARLGEALFALMVKSAKVPFDNDGIAQIESALRAVFKTCGQKGIIAKVVSEADQAESDEGAYQFTVKVPERSEVPENSRSARTLSGIKFRFILAGAIHKVTVDGTITV